MNIVRFNDPFEAAIRAWNPAGYVREFADEPEEGFEMPFKGWQHAPLFEYATTREREQAFMKAFLGNPDLKLETCAWPFETFRLSMLQTSARGWIENDRHVGDGRYRVDFIVTRTHERVHFLGNAIELYDETPGTISLARRYNPLILFMSDAHMVADNPDSYHFHCGMFASGRWIPQAQSMDVGHPLIQGMMDALAGFIMDSMTPGNHLVEVRPNLPGRSVEWVKARTHYTLITHGHPANSREVREGERVRNDVEGELKRMSGARRAHYKQLRHARYRFALNEQRFPGMPKGTIRVRATWCGPKEWQDEGGRQIYKVLEPVEAEATAVPNGQKSDL